MGGLAYLIHGAYWFLIPLAVIEGPLLALLCGVAARFGYINPFIAWGILVAGDLFPDIVYYWLGRWGATMPRVRAFATRTKLIRENLPDLEAAWRQNFFLALACAKLAYGVSPPLIVSIGLSGIPATRFFLSSIVIAVVYLGFLVGVGFGVGHAFGLTRGFLKNAPLYFGLVGFLCMCLLGGIAFFARRRLPHATSSNIIDR